MACWEEEGVAALKCREERFDILGNRTHQSGTPGVSFQYDKINRMKYFSPGIGHDDYWYRADGMRVYKNHASGVVWEEEEEHEDPGLDYIANYFYDGQMGFETHEARSNGAYLTTRNGLGARGIDFI